MAKYIDKSILVAEIYRRIKAIPKDETDKRLKAVYGNEGFVLMDLLDFLDTLEVREVDLEAELNTWRHNHFHGRRDKKASGEYLERVSQLGLAKHFFELGLKAQKGE